MARSLSAYLHRKDVPAREALQQALNALKVKLTLDDGYAPFESSGYLPCTLDGEDAGFTIRFSDVGEVASGALKAVLDGRDAAVDIKWSGDIREQVSALAVSSALAKDFGAIVHDPDKDVVLSADELVKKTRAAASELE